MLKHAVSTLCAVVVALPANAFASTDSERRIGDVLSYALPAATLGVELWRGDFSGAGQFGRSFVVTLAASEVLKRTAGVERPDRSNDQSFPSGHAARAFAAATYVHRRHGFESAWPLYVLATYVGQTRVQTHRHRWADVVGAAGISAASTWLLVDPERTGAGVALTKKGIFVSWSVPLR